MNGFESSVVVDRPSQEVFAVLANLQNDVTWRREWEDGKQTSDGPIGLGTRTALYGSFFGRRLEAIYEIDRYEPDHVVAWKTVSGPLPLTFQRSVERAEGGGTKVTIRYEMEVSGFFRLVGPLIKSAGERALRGDFPKLKALLEARTL